MRLEPSFSRVLPCRSNHCPTSPLSASITSGPAALAALRYLIARIDELRLGKSAPPPTDPAAASREAADKRRREAERQRRLLWLRSSAWTSVVPGW
jgi:hypothetical protein